MSYQHVRCPHCEKPVRIEYSNLDVDAGSLPNWEEDWECPHCDREFLLDIDVEIEITPMLPADES